MSIPRISVVMPVYNRDWCVAEAIDSVLATQEPGLELVVVDDGSSDCTPAILARYAARHPGRIRVIAHPGRVNRGIARSRNLGVSLSQGEFLAFLDSDDIYLPGRFKQSIPWLEQHPGRVGCIEPFSIVAMASPLSPTLSLHLTEIEAANHGWMRAVLFANTCWNMPTITLRREAVSTYGSFDEHLKFAEETALWLRLIAAEVVGVAQSSQPVACVRRHAQHSWDPADQVADKTTFMHVLLDIVKWTKGRPDVSPQSRKLVLEKLRTFLREILSDPQVPLPVRLDVWQRATFHHPRLLVDRSILGNLVRAPLRRRGDQAA